MNNQPLLLQRQLAMFTHAVGETIVRLLEDDDICEIMVNPDGKLWFESLQQGKCDSNIILPEKQRLNIIKLVASHNQQIVDYNHPELTGELPGRRARFQGWIPPVSYAPTFTIRKPAIRIFSLEDYHQSGRINAKQKNALQQAIQQRKNILIAGGTASGKTTLANALLNELNQSNQRVVVLEDIPELQVNIADCVKLCTTESKTMGDLVKSSLRMRPDRLIIGEVRDGKTALTLLKAWNTGHPGGICTIHANSVERALDRLADLLLEVVTTIPHQLIHQAIDQVVFMARDAKNGRHTIVDLINVKEPLPTQ